MSDILIAVTQRKTHLNGVMGCTEWVNHAWAVSAGLSVCNEPDEAQRLLCWQRLWVIEAETMGRGQLWILVEVHSVWLGN